MRYSDEQLSKMPPRKFDFLDYAWLYMERQGRYFYVQIQDFFRDKNDEEWIYGFIGIDPNHKAVSHFTYFEGESNLFTTEELMKRKDEYIECHNAMWEVKTKQVNIGEWIKEAEKIRQRK